MKSRSPLTCLIAVMCLSLAPIHAAEIKGQVSHQEEHPGAKGFPHAEFSVAGKGAPWMSSDPKAKKPKKWSIAEDLPSGEGLENRKLPEAKFEPNSYITPQDRTLTEQNDSEPSAPPSLRVPDGGTTWVMMFGSMLGLGIAARLARFRFSLRSV